MLEKVYVHFDNDLKNMKGNVSFMVIDQLFIDVTLTNDTMY